jgi:hypothetical protein
MKEKWICLSINLLLILSLSACDISVPWNTSTPAPEAAFWSDGDLISGWYWLRDGEYSNSARWIIPIPQNATAIIFNVEALATDSAGGGFGFDTQFFLSFGLPQSGDNQGMLLGRLPVSLPNIHPANPDTYLCRGTVSIPVYDLKGSPSLLLIAKRKDDLGGFPSINLHVAFNAASFQLSNR